jgi:outer membrane protein assembly factor BamB
LHCARVARFILSARFNLSGCLLLAAALMQPRAGFSESPTFRGDARHTGVYDASGVPSLNGIVWSFKTAGKVIGSPALVGENIYIGSTGGMFYALDRTSGAVNWKMDVKARIVSSPAVAGGIVYFGAYDGRFYALDARDGHLRWKFQTGGEHRYSATHLHGSEPASETMPDPFDCYLSSPVVENDAVYFGSGDGHVYALDAASGALKWKFKTGDVVHASPAIAHGVLFVGSWDSNFYAIDATTGQEKWRFKTGEDANMHNQVGIQSSAVVAEGTVYFGCRDAHLYALDEQTGKLRWSYSTKGSWVIASPVVNQGTIYFTTSDTGLLYAADAKTGAILYTVSFNHWPLFASPALAGGMIYIASTAGTVSGVDLASHKIAWTFATEASQKNAALFKPDGSPNYEAVFASDFYDDIMAGYGRLQEVGPILSSPIVADKVVYVGSVDGNVYALH